MENWKSRIEVSKEEMLKEIDEGKSETLPELHLEIVWRHSYGKLWEFIRSS